MANMAALDIAAANLKASEVLYRGEMRSHDTPAIDMLIDSTLTKERMGIAIQEPTSYDGKVATIKYRKRQSISIGSTRVCNPSQTRNDWASASITYATYSFPVSVSAKMCDYNRISPQEELQMQIQDGFHAFYQTFHAAIMTKLNTERSHVNVGTGFGTFDGTNFIMDIANADKNLYLEAIRVHLKQNAYYNTDYRIISDLLSESQFKQSLAQGTGNNVNYSWQPIPNAYFTPITPDTGEVFETFVLPYGLHYLQLKRDLYANGDSIGNKAWGSTTDPKYRFFNFDIFETADCGDSSAYGGATQDLIRSWQYSIDIALFLPPLSATGSTGETTCFKYSLATT